MRVVTTKDNEGNKDKVTDTTKVTILLSELQTWCKVRGGCIWSSATMGYVYSWYGRVVIVRSWTFDEGSWRMSSRGDTARCLMRVIS